MNAAPPPHTHTCTHLRRPVPQAFGALAYTPPHPAAEALGIHAHVWLNGGLCSPMRAWQLAPRWSTGVGVVVPSGLGKFEVNYCWVLSSSPNDRLRQGLQFTFGGG